jgi:hypothetical protein
MPDAMILFLGTIVLIAAFTLIPVAIGMIVYFLVGLLTSNSQLTEIMAFGSWLLSSAMFLTGAIIRWKKR